MSSFPIFIKHIKYNLFPILSRYCCYILLMLGFIKVNDANANNTDSSTFYNKQNLTYFLTQVAKTKGKSASSSILNQANSLASSKTEAWLNQFGKARANIGYDLQAKNLFGEVAFLLPISDTQTGPFTFSHMGVFHRDEETYANLGLGQRYLMDEWLLGYNAFIDRDMRNRVTRWGLGIESWLNYLKFSANAYLPLGGWQDARNDEYSEVRSAPGFDVRILGYLPNYSHLGASLTYEQYFGDDVSLFNNKESTQRQKDPYALTVGVNYTPVPLITLGLDYTISAKKDDASAKDNDSNKNKTLLSINLDYHFNVPLSQQLSSSKVQTLRTISYSKYDWVQRNYKVVLRNRKKDVITLNLPEKLSAFSGEEITFKLSVTSKFGLDKIIWDDQSTVIQAGGKIEEINSQEYKLTLPKKIGGYNLIGTAHDKNGNASKPQSIQINVDGLIINPKTLEGMPGTKVSFNIASTAEAPLKLSWGDLEPLSDIKFDTSTPKLGDNTITLPNHPGEHNLLINYEDAKGNKHTQEISIKVNDSTDKLVIHIPSKEEFPDSTLRLYEDPIQLTASGGNDNEYSWSSSNPDSVKIESHTGKMTFIGSGQATITVKSGDKSAEINLAAAPLLKFPNTEKHTFDSIDKQQLPSLQELQKIYDSAWQTKLKEWVKKQFTALDKECFVWTKNIYKKQQNNYCTIFNLMDGENKDRISPSESPEYVIYKIEASS